MLAPYRAFILRGIVKKEMQDTFNTDWLLNFMMILIYITL